MINDRIDYSKISMVINLVDETRTYNCFKKIIFNGETKKFIEEIINIYELQLLDVTDNGNKFSDEYNVVINKMLNKFKNFECQLYMDIKLCINNVAGLEKVASDILKLKSCGNIDVR